MLNFIIGYLPMGIPWGKLLLGLVGALVVTGFIVGGLASDGDDTISVTEEAIESPEAWEPHDRLVDAWVHSFERVAIEYEVPLHSGNLERYLRTEGNLFADQVSGGWANVADLIEDGADRADRIKQDAIDLGISPRELILLVDSIAAKGDPERGAFYDRHGLSVEEWGQLLSGIQDKMRAR